MLGVLNLADEVCSITAHVLSVKYMYHPELLDSRITKTRQGNMNPFFLEFFASCRHAMPGGEDLPKRCWGTDCAGKLRPVGVLRVLLQNRGVDPARCHGSRLEDREIRPPRNWLGKCRGQRVVGKIGPKKREC